MAEGWISLHRKIRNNPIFNDLELLRLWLICLTEATHKPREQIVGRKMVPLEPGEFVTGRYALQAMYNAGLNPEQQKSPFTVWRWLVFLETAQFVSIKSSNKYSVVAILNWDKYQKGEHDIEHQMSNKRASNEQQVSTNNNVNNDNNDNKLKIKPLLVPPPYSEIIDFLNMKAGTKFKHTTKATQEHIRARWKEKFTLPDFQTVIEKKCAEWIGTDMAKFLCPETLFGTKFERYLNQAGEDHEKRWRRDERTDSPSRKVHRPKQSGWINKPGDDIPLPDLP